MPLKLRAVGKTDKGLVRSGNEDNLHVDMNHNVFVVCDGMGGHQAGEVASMLAVEVVRLAFGRFSGELRNDPALQLGVSLPESSDLLLKSIRLANHAIHSRASVDSTLSGMGTTIVATAFEGDFITVAHVGDSRAYRLDANELIPLTTDHSWLTEVQKTQQLTRQEASSLVGKNIITRALGVRDFVEIDYQILKVQPGQIFILCSDGLCGFAEDEEIFRVASKHRSDLNKMADSLVQMANDRGGMDNVTVVIIQVQATGTSNVPERAVMTQPRESTQALDAADKWMERFAAEPQEAGGAAPGTSGGGSGGGAKGGTGMLLGIFAIFAFVAVLILYLARTH